MKKTALSLVLVLFVGGALSASAQTSTSSLQQLLDQLKQQVATLQAQIDAANKAQSAVQEAKQDVKGTLKLIKQLREGMSGEDVKLLQEFLATDPEIYPEGKVTGYFGKLTAKAVKNFQKKAGVEQVGNVGPKTLQKINELLTEGAGNSGKVPPGLLIAPGILKKLGFTPQPLPGQVLPPGIAKKFATSTATSTPDTTAPAISAVSVAGITATGATVLWTTNEVSNSRVWYATSSPVVATSSTPNTGSAGLVISHTVGLTGLTASTTYRFVVSSADASGNSTTSAEFSFTTAPPPDLTAPTISAVLAASTMATSTHITWTTNENSDSAVWYSTSTPVVATSTTPNVTSATLVTSHDMALSNLVASTTYYYAVSSKDAVGNTATSGEFWFNTTQ